MFETDEALVNEIKNNKKLIVKNTEILNTVEQKEREEWTKFIRVALRLLVLVDPLKQKLVRCKNKSGKAYYDEVFTIYEDDTYLICFNQTVCKIYLKLNKENIVEPLLKSIALVLSVLFSLLGKKVEYEQVPKLQLLAQLKIADQYTKNPICSDIKFIDTVYLPIFQSLYQKMLETLSFKQKEKLNKIETDIAFKNLVSF